MFLTLFDSMENISEEAVSQMLPLLSTQRREEALRYKHLFGQYCCAKSYLMLRDILIENYLISEDDSMEMIRDEHGKPSLLQHPQLHFNLSHCKQAIAVAVDNNPIGIDVEGFRNPTESLLHYTMNEEEAAQVQQSSMPERTFAEYWTQKEALFKLTGTGITSDIKEILALKDPQVNLVTRVFESKHYVLSVASLG